MTHAPRPAARHSFRLFLILILGAALARAHGVTEEMMNAAAAFLDGLSPELRAKATFPFEDAERETWFYVPRDRNGVSLDEMNDAQRKLGEDLLKSGLSDRGYATVNAIIALESILKDIGDAPELRDPFKYYFTVFGTPSEEEPWGWRVEGHHVSLHFTIAGDELVEATPSFFGSNPAEIRNGTRDLGLRVLADEEDLAYALMDSFDSEQRAAAIISDTAPRDIVTGNSSQVDPLNPSGLPVSRMTAEQSDRLLTLVRHYFGRYQLEISDEAYRQLMEAGWENVAFAWAGSTERGAQHYYRIQGPTFLMELDNTQGNGNHIHSVWRDFNGDFGRNLLQEHYETDHDHEE